MYTLFLQTNSTVELLVLLSHLPLPSQPSQYQVDMSEVRRFRTINRALGVLLLMYGKLEKIPTMTRFVHCTEDKYFSTTQFPNIFDHFDKSLAFRNIL